MDVAATNNEGGDSDDQTLSKEGDAWPDEQRLVMDGKSRGTERRQQLRSSLFNNVGFFRGV